jgi:maltose O-acetyltransferase
LQSPTNYALTVSNSFQFLNQKFGKIGLLSLVKGQIEALVVGLISWIPTVFGMAIRNVAYRALGMKIDGFCWIQPGVTFVNLGKLKVGRNFACNTGSYLNALGGITMGDDVLIGSNVTVSAGKHGIEGRELSVISRPAEPTPIQFGNDVWLGAGVVILPGVTLADGTVVGSNSVVTRDTDPYSVVAGCPARPLRRR